MKTKTLVISGLFLLFGLAGFSQDKAGWTKAVGEFQKNSVSTNEETRAKAVDGLVQAMYPEVEIKAVTMLMDLMADELNRGSQREEKIKFVVIDACVTALQKISEPKAVERLLKEAAKNNLPWRQQFYLIKSLGGINQPAVIAKLIELLDDKDEKIVIAVIDALAELKAKEAVQKIITFLDKEGGWEIKISAADYFRKLNSQETIGPLINVMGSRGLEGRTRAEVAEVLKSLTGVDYGMNAADWADWWRKKQKGETVTPSQNGDTKSVTLSYYGVNVTTTSVIFILDISGSMGMLGTAKETVKETRPEPRFTGPDNKSPVDPKISDAIKAKKEEVDKRPIKTRMDAAKKELINTIYHLDPTVNFTIIFYSTGTSLWREMLVPATAENKKIAIEEIDRMAPTGGTSTYDALELAYKLTGQKSGKNTVVQVNKKGDYITEMGGADTIFLATDGAPTSGKIIERPDILNEIKKIHATRKIKINTVAVGGPDDPSQSPETNARNKPDVKFLRDLADITGGVCVDTSAP